MLIGTVVGNVWATRKDPTLVGVRFLVVQPFTLDGKPSAETIVAVDPLGAGIGERVLVVFGRAARHAIGKGHDVGFQCAVSAIVDKMELEDGRMIGQVAAQDEPAPAPQGLNERNDMQRNDQNPEMRDDVALEVCIGLLELCSVARGVEVADAVLKEAKRRDAASPRPCSPAST